MMMSLVFSVVIYLLQSHVRTALHDGFVYLKCQYQLILSFILASFFVVLRMPRVKSRPETMTGHDDDAGREVQVVI